MKKLSISSTLLIASLIANLICIGYLMLSFPGGLSSLLQEFKVMNAHVSILLLVALLCTLNNIVLTSIYLVANYGVKQSKS